ncbi:copper amine oxidase [Exiguobacterium sp. KRL4]|uniref:copper amine oxidase n=1 Tax=Exiguobacterium sp. KRL4 TaxID=1914536 RepID=UPI0008F83DC9|nr:copper amine oxidase [Exiguobacterium sp. KRL4]OIN67203.1 copper amine oxidase [Exiguobacterium sp. KRL4]
MKMKKSYLAVPLSAALLVPAAGVSAHGHEDHSKMSHSSGKVSLDVSSPASDLRATLDQLLSEHAYLAVVTMQKGIDGKEDFDQAAGALSQNTDDLSAAVGSVYGDEAGEAFKEIWSSHIGYFVDYVKATGAKDEDAKQKALKELDEYRVEQAAFLDKATEGRLKAADLEGGLKVHITQLLTSFDSYVAGDYDATYSNLRIAIEHMYMVGEGLSGAIVDQYSDKFKNTKVDTPAADLRAGLNRNFSEHAALAILTMQKGIDGAKDFDAAAGALNENTDDLSASIGSVYGSEAAQEFKKIWSSHIGYFVDYVKATGAKDEEARDMAVQELDEYRVEQAAFLDAATEGRLKSKDLEEGLKVHIDQLLLAFNSYNEKDYDKTYPAIREAYGHMYGVGEGTATAIVDQFPDKFQGSPAGMPNTGLGGAAEAQSSAGILWSLLGIAAASILGFFGLRGRRSQQ